MEAIELDLHYPYIVILVIGVFFWKELSTLQCSIIIQMLCSIMNPFFPQQSLTTKSPKALTIATGHRQNFHLFSTSILSTNKKRRNSGLNFIGRNLSQHWYCQDSIVFNVVNIIIQISSKNDQMKENSLNKNDYF